MTDHLLVDISDGVATLTFNRPKELNAFSMEMRHAMFDVVPELENNREVRCVVLTGAGGNFMAGGDVKSFLEFTRESPEWRRSYFERRIHNLDAMLISLTRMEKPVIASVEGAAAGAGMSFMMACDMTVADEKSVFRFAYSAIGTTPDASGSYWLPRLVGLNRAKEIAMLADRMDAKQALDWGLINRIAPAGTLAEETLKLARRLADGPTLAYGGIKKLMNAAALNHLETHLAMEAENFGRCAGSEDWVEGVTAFNEKRKPVFKGR
ncbi:MAG: enoyl-CoA hydratase [Paracoccaceae bacterium]